MLNGTAQQFDHDIRAVVDAYMKKVDDDKLANAEMVGVLDCVRFDILACSHARAHDNSLSREPHG